jgi:pyruvate,water dikinase
LLENGQPVTVDADSLRVCRGKIEPLLQEKETPKGLMGGSPVLEILKRVSESIIPLHLLDPEASDFKPSQCRSFHDISRFCHEKSVMEMFSFGKNHHFSERASKQLVCKIPMQWWVLNLDDGFREDVPGKFVHLDNIVSIPMLALWEGIVAVPWEGPPPVDSKGFMSILMEASSNPALDPSMPSPYANRNYFMISKNFCSLSSRFGFHFSSTEALVGERAGENYISFAFQGGAADQGRRVRRACFVGAILEEFEFRSEIRKDGVTARLEGYDEEVMKEKLKILGYLLIHTRQLDMVMFNDDSCVQLKSKLLVDISSVILSKSSSAAALN